MELKNWLEGRILVLAHVGDIDACSSFVAFKELCHKINPQAIPEFSFFGALNREGEKMLNLFRLKISEYKKLELEKFEKIVLIDTQKNLLPDALAKKDVFIVDHHAGSGEKAVSTTELVYNLFKKHNLQMSQKCAEAIIYGIISDTAGLRFAKTETFKLLYEILSEHKIEYQDLLEKIASEVEHDERLAWLKAAGRTETKILNGKIVALSHVGGHESSSASKLISLGADISLVISRKTKETRIIGRARKGIDLAKIFSEVAEKVRGQGGGHPGACVINFQPEKEKEALNLILRGIK